MTVRDIARQERASPSRWGQLQPTREASQANGVRGIRASQGRLILSNITVLISFGTGTARSTWAAQTRRAGYVAVAIARQTGRTQ